MADESFKTNASYDLLVIGSGPAGIHAAVQASKLQKRVAIIERSADRLGGAWIHTGTLPSKTLREVLDAVHSIKFHAGSAWVDRVVADLSTTKLFGRARLVAQQEEELVKKHLDSNRIAIIRGHGRLIDQHTVCVIGCDGESRLIGAKNILIATGSRPRRPLDIPFDGWRVVDSDEILALENVPRSLVIYGAGVIGCEYACIFGGLGVETTIIDSRASIMQTVDREVSSELQRSMEQMGIRFKLGQAIDKVTIEGPKVALRCGDELLTSDVLFVAAGRISNTEELGLETLGIKTDSRGAIIVNGNFQTTAPNVYAAGDAIGAPALAATSAEQGRHAACHAFGIATCPFPNVFPIGVYTIPELSSVGRTEDELKAAGVDYVVGRASFGEIARGYIRGDDHGLLKLLVCQKTHVILGIHIVGNGACDLVHIGMAYMLKGGHAQDLVNMIFNYPTLAEAYRVAAFNALNKLFPAGVIADPPSGKEAA